MIGNLVRACILLLALLVASGVHAQSQAESLAYIEKILQYLNNNIHCTLPTYNEVNELQECFERLQGAWGADFESRLTDDQRLVRRTLLLHWDSFKRHMESAVIVRSAKKRSFLCKIEDYQEAKFGDSVCTRLKDIRGPITNHIFEKNPIVRYMKHLKTGHVIEPPVESTPDSDPLQVIEAESSVGNTDHTNTEAQASAKPDSTGMEPVAPNGELELTDESQPATQEESTKIDSQVAEFKSENENEPKTQVVNESQKAIDEPEAKRPEGELGQARDEHEQEGVQHTYIGKFTIDFANPPDKIQLEFERAEKQAEARKLDNDRDPLDDIPVPSSSDESQESLEERRSEPSGAADENQSSASSAEQVPMFDEFGAEYIEEEYDDAQLERLVRVPKSDWQFDPVYGYFKWPDECQPQTCPIGEQLDEAMLVPTGAWHQFLSDPYAYDELLETIERNKPTTPKPKINAARLRKQKGQFGQSILDESRRDQMFGWNNEKAPKKIELYMPEISRDRWRSMADNGLCKIVYNADYVKNKSKKGLRKVKNLFGSDDEQRSLRRRQTLLSSPTSIGFDIK